jgi:FixJ family two-component response regulator
MRLTKTGMVFVIDDAAVRRSIQGLLNSVGLRLDSFDAAQEFLSSERTDGPSCLVLDIRLPDLNGLDFQHQCPLNAASQMGKDSL